MEKIIALSTWLTTEGPKLLTTTVAALTALIAVSIGISTVLGSFSKGAPLRIFSSETTGQPDIYWFVPAASPIKSPADFKDKTIGYSVAGSSSHAALLALLAQEKVTAKPTPTGGVTPAVL